MSHFQQDFIKVVIEIYGLELDDRPIDEVLSAWMQKYDRTWVLKAIVESLYRGRYKIVCVESILSNWQRLGNPRYQFTPEYEREILAPIPEIVSRDRVSDDRIVVHPPATDSLAKPFTRGIDPESAPQTRIDPAAESRHQKINCESLNPEESAPFQSPYTQRSTLRYPSKPVYPDDRAAEPAPTKSPELTEQPPIDECLASRSLPLAQQLPSQANLDQNHHDEIERDCHSSKPVNRRLFDTLKTIVDPNRQHKLGNDTSNSQSLKGRHVSNIARFKMTLEQPSEELQL